VIIRHPFYFFRGGIETKGRAPGNLHYGLPVIFKGGKKRRQDGLHEDQD
jgi:hypothetical protein